MEFSFDTKTNNDDKLIEPLLDLDDTEVSYDDADDDIACSCTIQIGSDLDDDEDDEEVDETTVTCRDTTILLLLFPLLLMAQFGMVFANPVADASLTVAWSTVNYVIVMFAVTSWLYRHTLADLQVSNIFLLVVPEVLLNVILGLVLWDNAAVGFLGLLVSLFALGLFVAISSLRILISSGCEEETKADEEEIVSSNYQAVTY